MADRRGQLDVSHALAADLRPGNFHATAIADDALIAHPLVFAAIAFKVLRRAEDALAEETVLLRLEGTVIDGLRLGYLSIRPVSNLFWGGQRNADRIKVIRFRHC